MAGKLLDIFKYLPDNLDIKNLELIFFQTEVTVTFFFFFLNAVQQVLSKTELNISPGIQDNGRSDSLV